MSADVLLDIDPLLLEELDAPIPCEGEMHPIGSHGHDPMAPAAYLQVVPGCTCPGLYKCEGYRRYFIDPADRGTSGYTRCDRCGARCPNSEVRFIPITESSS